MSEWKRFKMDDLIDEISMGPFGSDIKVSCFVEKGIPVLNGSNLFGTRLKEDSFRYVTPEKADSLKKANAYRGDVIVTHRGTLGQIVYIPQNSTQPRYVISQSQFRFRCNDNVIPEYVVNYFHSHEGQNKILANASQVGVPALARASSSFRDIEIPVPPLPTQRKIAALLSSLDDKIENNRKICANLEAQAQAIFKSWFVDFEPFGGKMPQGWKITSIYDFAEIIYGAPFKSNLFNEKAIGRPIIRIRDLKNNETKTFTTEHHDKEYLVHPGDLVVGMDGEFRPYIWGNYPALLNQRVCVFKPLDNVSTAFLYCTIKPQLALVEATEAATTVIHIGKEDFDSFKILLPSERWLGKFNDVAQNAFAAMTKYRLESRTLAALRDALLPKLMSGEIDVEKVKVA